MKRIGRMRERARSWRTLLGLLLPCVAVLPLSSCTLLFQSNEAEATSDADTEGTQDAPADDDILPSDGNYPIVIQAEDFDGTSGSDCEWIVQDRNLTGALGTFTGGGYISANAGASCSNVCDGSDGPDGEDAECGTVEYNLGIEGLHRVLFRTNVTTSNGDSIHVSTESPTDQPFCWCSSVDGPECDVTICASGRTARFVGCNPQREWRWASRTVEVDLQAGEPLRIGVRELGFHIDAMLILPIDDGFPLDRVRVDGVDFVDEEGLLAGPSHCTCEGGDDFVCK